MKNVLKCKSLRMNVKKRLYEGLMVSTELYGTETDRKYAAGRQGCAFEDITVTSGYLPGDGIYL